MKKTTLFLFLLFLSIGAMAQVNYTPTNTGAKTNTGRNMTSVVLGSTSYSLASNETGQCYVDKYDALTFCVEAGKSYNLEINTGGSWIHGFVFVDFAKDGFTASVTESWKPAEDLVAYSFYNNNGSSDASGYNSVGATINGDDRNRPAIPSWTVPADMKPGEYRVRFKLDWCNIDPDGDKDGKFNDFMANGGQILDAKLVVLDKSELQALITEAEELLSKVSEAQKTVGEELDITGKISSNAAQNKDDGNSGGTYNTDDGAGIAGLTDNNPETYFHSRWSGTAVNADHYLQIDLGENDKLSDFCFEYATRETDNPNLTSPAPLAIEVRVSVNGSNFGNPIAVFTKDANGLPTHADLGATWRSDVISATEDIRYIRLTVTDSKGPGDDTWNNHHFFAMGTLNIYPASTTYSVKEGYSNVITVENVEDAIAALAAANSANNGTITLDELNNATNTLNAALNALRVVYTYTLNVTSAGWASLYLDFPAAIPDFGGEDEEAGVYIVTGVKEDNWLNLVKVDEGVLPANTGVIVKAAQGTYEFKYSAEDAADVSANILKGTVKDEYIEGKAYVLGNKNGIGFYQAELNKNATGNDGTTHFKNNAYKSYLLATDIPATLSRSAGFRFSFGGTTAVEEVEMRNEREEIYDLTGRRLSEITKPGIYIINGNKVLVK